MRVSIVTANYGNFDKEAETVPQSIPCDFYRFNEKNFPLRHCSFTPRMQARLVKCFNWQLAPGYDYYIWVDSSCILSRPDSAEWFIKQLGDADMLVFKHPNRNTVQEEADYLKKRLRLEQEGKKGLYVLPRYENEDIDGILKEVNPQAPLYASTAFVMRNNKKTQEAMKEYFYLTARYHLIDQLGFPEAIKDLKVNVIEENYMRTPYLEYIRNKK